MKLNTYWKDIKRCICLIVISGIVGWLLLVVAYMLPVEPIERNVKAALDELIELGPSPRLISDNAASRLDIYSDSVMLNEAIYRGDESIWERAVGGYEYIYEGKTAFQSLLAYLSGDAGGVGVEYARYWHGYLILLKPLLIFFSYGDIRAINFLIQLLLTGVVTVGMCRRKMHMQVYAFLLGIYSLMPLSVAMCLEYSIILNITLVSCAVLMNYYEIMLDKKLVNLFYVMIGVVVCYCDLLTYPLVALGFVLILNITLDCNDKGTDLLEIIREVIVKSLFWGCGYVGIWGIKWILASIFMKQNILKEAVLFVLYRASTAASDSGVEENFSRIQALSINLNTIIGSVLIITLVISLGLVLLKTWRMRRVSIDAVQTMGKLVVAVFPFIWVAFTANHAYIHYWMVYREFSITVFAVASIIVSLLGTDST